MLDGAPNGERQYGTTAHDVATGDEPFEPAWLQRR
jgi:hypothetical protein